MAHRAKIVTATVRVATTATVRAETARVRAETASATLRANPTAGATATDVTTETALGGMIVMYLGGKIGMIY